LIDFGITFETSNRSPETPANKIAANKPRTELFRIWDIEIARLAAER